MPEPFLKDYEWIRQELTKVPDDEQGAIAATLNEMSDERALEIAQRIVDLAFEIAMVNCHEPR